MIKLSKNMLREGRNSCGISVSSGPWIQGVRQDQIKIRAKGGNVFPAWVRSEVTVLNDSNMMVDYFEPDSFKLFPGDILYPQAAENVAYNNLKELGALTTINKAIALRRMYDAGIPQGEADRAMARAIQAYAPKEAVA